jgi:hypothetical protein
METFDQSIVRGVQELREHTRNMFPDKSSAQHTRRIVAFQFGWVDRHLMDIKNMRAGFSTKEVSLPEHPTCVFTLPYVTAQFFVEA